VTLTHLPVPGPGTSRLRGALLAASFTPDGVRDLLGAPADDALGRGEPVPARRATRGDDRPLAVLVRLFLLRQAVPYAAAGGALPLAAALGEGWLARDGDEVWATVDVRPYAGDAGQDWWIVSDARGAPGRDVVLGTGGASATLAALTVRRPVGRVLDLGSGCGVQALHATAHARHVTATDVNPRALRMTALTLALSGAPVPDPSPVSGPSPVPDPDSGSGPAHDLREGSLFEPLRDGETFDLIVSNPPFVISPADHGEGLTYRDGGMAGDELCRTLVGAAAARLADGGHCQLLANWRQVRGEDWRERVASWVPPGCDAWIVRREEQDVARYAELWLRDAGLHRGDPAAYDAAYDAWLAAFGADRTEAVGFGWITLRARRAAARPEIVVEDWPHAVAQPLGDTVLGHFAARDFLRDRDEAALLAARYALADGVVQEQIGSPGAEDPEHVVLRQRHGMLRARSMDTVGAGFAGTCDGTLPASTILDAIATLLEEDPATLRDGAGEWLRPLVEQGFLLPVT
jgi:methylase of polypeptide subunit release factors